MSDIEKSEFCQFCDILNKRSGLLYEDSQFFAFHDISKASAAQHVLVCTTQHLESCYDIKDAARLKRMKGVGELILSRLRPNGEYKFGFHTGRFISVHHVHLHCFVLPFSNIIMEKVRYGSLLRSVEHVLTKLKRGQL